MDLFILVVLGGVLLVLGVSGRIASLNRWAEDVRKEAYQAYMDQHDRPCEQSFRRTP